MEINRILLFVCAHFIMRNSGVSIEGQKYFPKENCVDENSNYYSEDSQLLKTHRTSKWFDQGYGENRKKFSWGEFVNKEVEKRPEKKLNPIKKLFSRSKNKHSDISRPWDKNWTELIKIIHRPSSGLGHVDLWLKDVRKETKEPVTPNNLGVERLSNMKNHYRRSLAGSKEKSSHIQFFPLSLVYGSVTTMEVPTVPRPWEVKCCPEEKCSGKPWCCTNECTITQRTTTNVNSTTTKYIPYNNTAVTSNINNTAVTNQINDNTVTGHINDNAVTRHTDNTAVNGPIENTAVTGHNNNPAVTGHINNPTVTGHTNNPTVTGHTNNPTVTGHIKNPAVTGHNNNHAVTGYIDNPAVTGHTNNPAVTGHNNNPAVTGHTNNPTVTGLIKNPAVTGHNSKHAVTGYIDNPAVTGHNNNPAVTGHINDNAVTGHINDPAVTGHIDNPNVNGYIDNPDVTGHIDKPDLNDYINNPEVTGYIGNLAVTDHIDNLDIPSEIDNPDVTDHINNPTVTGRIDNTVVTSHIDNHAVTGYIDILDIPGEIDNSAVISHIKNPAVTGHIDNTVVPSHIDNTSPIPSRLSVHVTTTTLSPNNIPITTNINHSTPIPTTTVGIQLVKLQPVKVVLDLNKYGQQTTKISENQTTTVSSNGTTKSSFCIHPMPCSKNLSTNFDSRYRENPFKTIDSTVTDDGGQSIANHKNLVKKNVYADFFQLRKNPKTGKPVVEKAPYYNLVALVPTIKRPKHRMKMVLCCGNETETEAPAPQTSPSTTSTLNIVVSEMASSKSTKKRKTSPTVQTSTRRKTTAMKTSETVTVKRILHTNVPKLEIKMKLLDATPKYDDTSISDSNKLKYFKSNGTYYLNVNKFENRMNYKVHTTDSSLIFKNNQDNRFDDNSKVRIKSQPVNSIVNKELHKSNNDYVSNRIGKEEIAKITRRLFENNRKINKKTNKIDDVKFTKPVIKTQRGTNTLVTRTKLNNSTETSDEKRVHFGKKKNDVTSNRDTVIDKKTNTFTPNERTSDFGVTNGYDSFKNLRRKVVRKAKEGLEEVTFSKGLSNKKQLHSDLKEIRNKEVALRPKIWNGSNLSDGKSNSESSELLTDSLQYKEHEGDNRKSSVQYKNRSRYRENKNTNKKKLHSLKRSVSTPYGQALLMLLPRKPDCLHDQSIVRPRSIFGQLLPCCIGKAPKQKDPEKKPWEQPWKYKPDKFQVVSKVQPMDADSTEGQLSVATMNPRSKPEVSGISADNHGQANRKSIFYLDRPKQDGRLELSMNSLNNVLRTRTLPSSIPHMKYPMENFEEDKDNDKFFTYVLNYTKGESGNYDSFVEHKNQNGVVKTLRILEKTAGEPKFYMEIPDYLGELIKETAESFKTRRPANEVFTPKSNPIFDSKYKPWHGIIEHSTSSYSNVTAKTRSKPLLVYLQPFEVNQQPVYFPYPDIYHQLQNKIPLPTEEGLSKASTTDDSSPFNFLQDDNKLPKGIFSGTPIPFALVPAYLPLQPQYKLNLLSDDVKTVSESSLQGKQNFPYRFRENTSDLQHIGRLINNNNDDGKTVNGEKKYANEQIVHQMKNKSSNGTTNADSNEQISKNGMQMNKLPYLVIMNDNDNSSYIELKNPPQYKKDIKPIKGSEIESPEANKQLYDQQLMNEIVSKSQEYLNSIKDKGYETSLNLNNTLFYDGKSLQ